MGGLGVVMGLVLVLMSMGLAVLLVGGLVGVLVFWLLLPLLFWAWLGLLGWLVARWFLSGPDLSAFDQPAGQAMGRPGPASAEHQAVVASLSGAGSASALQGQPRRQRIALLRQYMDEVFPYDQPDVRLLPVREGGLVGEWVLTPGARPGRRLLYLHGGAFAVGSPRSHRRITVALSRLTGAAVFALDYRLIPEHPRRAGIEDTRHAYRWLLDHGPGDEAQPSRPGPAETLWVAGDSAGGNLTLSLLPWVRDQGLRAPDAAVAFSPATDATMVSPSWRSNRATDPMLGPLIGPMLRVPRVLLLWGTWLMGRINPRHPDVSPVYGDLSGLPPVLVQCSEAEMLRDDGRRYANRARAAGSPVQLQVWPHMVHVWQIFHPDLAEGREALDEAARFLRASLVKDGDAETEAAA